MTVGIDASTTALVVMDYQGSILGGLGDTSELVAKTASVVGRARAAGLTIAYVRVGFTRADVESFPTFSMMGKRIKAAGEAMSADAPTTAVHAHLEPAEGDIEVRKTRVGAFSTTDLDERLANKGITHLVLAGVHTSGVVLTTVREAHDLDYDVVVLSDLCADPDPEVHRFLVESIFPKQGHTLTSDEFVGSLAGVPA